MVVTKKIWVDVKVALKYEIEHEEDAELQDILDTVYDRIPNLELHMSEVISSDDRLGEMLYEVEISEVNMMDEYENTVRLQ